MKSDCESAMSLQFERGSAPLSANSAAAADSIRHFDFSPLGRRLAKVGSLSKQRVPFRTEQSGPRVHPRLSPQIDKRVDVADLIDAIGSELFADQILGYLHRSFGASRCAIYGIVADVIMPISDSLCIDKSTAARRQGRRSMHLYLSGNYWRRDTALREGLEQLKTSKISLVRTDIPSLGNSLLSENLFKRYRIADRVLLCTGSTDAAVVIHILREEPAARFSDEELSKLHHDGETIMSIVSKHLDVVERKATMGTALSSLPMIMETMASVPVQLSAREADVCARILYGMSAMEISAELSVGPASVVTYRKRAYQKLNVATHHELLMWYIGRVAERFAKESLPRGNTGWTRDFRVSIR